MSFNIRAYAVVTRGNRLLLSRELIKGMELLKFPGGGLNWGEGLSDCLKREMQEETGLIVETGDCFYVTDFFVPSMFDKSQQVISCYFHAWPAAGQVIPAERISDMSESAAAWHQLEWADIEKLRPEDLYFPIDKVVLSKLQQALLNK